MNTLKSQLILCARNLRKTYCPDDENKRVEALNLEQLNVRTGELVAVLGSSGSGKSTLVNCLAVLEFPDKNPTLKKQDGTSMVLAFNDGGTWYDAWENAIWYRQNFSGIVFQNFQLLPNLDVTHNVEMPIRLLQCEQYSPNSGERLDKVAHVLRLVGMDSYMKHRPMELSGGQQQRVAIARALIKVPKLLLADEPTGNLDERNKDGVVQLLRQLAVGGVAVVMVTHDERYAKKYADRIIRLEDGRIIENQENQVAMKFKPLSMGKMDGKATAGKPQRVVTGESTATMYATEEENVKGNIWSVSYWFDLIKGVGARRSSAPELTAPQDDTREDTAPELEMLDPVDGTEVASPETESKVSPPEADSKGADDTGLPRSESLSKIASETENENTKDTELPNPQGTGEARCSTEASIQEAASKPEPTDKKEEAEVESVQAMEPHSDESRSGSQQKTDKQNTEKSENEESPPKEAVPPDGSGESPLIVTSGRVQETSSTRKSETGKIQDGTEKDQSGKERTSENR